MSRPAAGGHRPGEAAMPDAQHREPIRFLVFSASLREGSLNAELARLAAVTIEANQGEVDLRSMRDFDTPSYNADVQNEEGFPPGAEEFRRCLEAANGFVVVSPEDTASMPRWITNSIDWVSRLSPQPFTQRAGLLLPASPSVSGGNRAPRARR